MKKFNLNSEIYIQITQKGWRHLKNTVGEDYTKFVIDTKSNKKIIDGKVWHKLQAHVAFNCLPVTDNCNILFSTNIMIDEKSLD